MKQYVALFLLLGCIALPLPSHAHCEIPCGIYDDEARIALILEHAQTIEKSMNEINTLSVDEAKNINQMVRWVNNKEEHATKIQEIVSQYFMHQRIKPKAASDAFAYDKYILELSTLHQISIEAMKAKQTTDLAHVKKIEELVGEFEASYF